MTTPGGSDKLTCGRSADDILAQVADGDSEARDAHQLQCPHCQAALAEYDRLWAPVRSAMAEPVEVPDTFLETALARIRSAVEHSDYGILTSAQGRTRIAARVVVVAARHTAEQVPGVRVALSKHLGGRDDQSGTEVIAGVAGRSTAVEVTLAADYGLNLPDLADRVRREVTARIRALTSLEPVQVTVVIDDIFN